MKQLLIAFFVLGPLLGARAQIHFKIDSLPIQHLTTGIDRRTISGKQGTLGYFTFAKGAEVPWHQHVQEQYTFILKGSVEVSIGDKVYRVKAGEGLLIPSNVPHRFVSLEDGTIDLDFFTPVRQDWVDGTDNYFKQPKSSAN